VIDLETDADDNAWVLARTDAEPSELLRFSPRGIEAQFDPPEDSLSVAPSGGRLGLAAGSSGFLVLDEEHCAWTRAALPDAARVLDAAAIADGWWILVRDDVPGSERLVRLDFDLNAGAALPASGAERVATDVDGGSLWLLGDGGTWARRVASAHGEARGFTHLAALGAAELAVDAHGALLLAAAGAVLRLDGSGFPMPGQGGFLRLVDLTRVPAL
jgi:hypothetical protein